MIIWTLVTRKFQSLSHGRPNIVILFLILKLAMFWRLFIYKMILIDTHLHKSKHTTLTSQINKTYSMLLFKRYDSWEKSFALHNFLTIFWNILGYFLKKIISDHPKTKLCFLRNKICITFRPSYWKLFKSRKNIKILFYSVFNFFLSFPISIHMTSQQRSRAWQKHSEELFSNYFFLKGVILNLVTKYFFRLL